METLNNVRGYTYASQEFEQTLRKITMLGFGIIFIAHSDVRLEKTGDGEETVEIIGPKLDKRCYSVISPMVDIIGYIGGVPKEGSDLLERFLWTRETPRIFAGSRFRHLPARIPFGYNELVQAISEAIDKMEAEGAEVVDYIPPVMKQNRPFTEALIEARDIWKDKIQSNPDLLTKANSIIESIYGRKMKLSETTENQQELLEAVIDELKNL